MNDKLFASILGQAIEGDKKAIEIIIDEYGNIINKYCCDKNGVNEDCKQYIKYKIIKEIKKFKIN